MVCYYIGQFAKEFQQRWVSWIFMMNEIMKRPYCMISVIAFWIFLLIINISQGKTEIQYSNVLWVSWQKKIFEVTSKTDFSPPSVPLKRRDRMQELMCSWDHHDLVFSASPCKHCLHSWSLRPRQQSQPVPKNRLWRTKPLTLVKLSNMKLS